MRALEQEADDGTLTANHPEFAHVVEITAEQWCARLNNPLYGVDGTIWLSEREAADLIGEKLGTFQDRRRKGYGPRMYFNDVEQRYMVRLNDLVLWYVARRTFTDSSPIRSA